MTQGAPAVKKNKNLSLRIKRKRKREGRGERMVVRQGRSWSSVAEGGRGGKPSET